LIYRAGSGPDRKGPILWLDATGATQPLLEEPGTYYTIRMSPDGTRLALAIDYSERGREIAVYDIARKLLTRLTFTKEVNLFPAWTPDGRFIAFESSSSSGYGIAIVRADGSGAPVRLLENPGVIVPWSFSSDGKTLAFYKAGADSGFDIWTAALVLGADGVPRLEKPAPLLQTSFTEYTPAYSPDGRWLAYSSNEANGRIEVYVRPASGAGAKWRASIDGGRGPIWAADGRRLFFLAPDRRIMVLEYTERAGAFVPGAPRVWSPAQTQGTAFGPADQTLAPSGERFAILPPASPPRTQPGHMTFVLGFFDDLKRRVQ
jgi:Tol biopolymer transport system component